MSRSVPESLRSAVGSTRLGQVAYPHLVKGRLGVERWSLGLRSRPAAGAARARIVAYHSVGTPEWGVNDVTPAAFERHLQLAVDDGWTFATPSEVLARPDEQLLSITFDDGVRSVLQNAVPVLRAHGVPATMFVVTGWADGGHEGGYDHVLDWYGLDALQRAGMELGSHSVTHPDFSTLDDGQVRRELAESRARLTRMLGVDTAEFAIPYGQSANWDARAQAAALDAGYAAVYAQAVDTRTPGTIARTFVTAFDRPTVFRAALHGAFDGWEEWS
ncbi:polysaccharide deacetylase family protein [Pseudonocardia ailaonensis]|uniref:Polysaccharide deacetylase family protein n=1 Tax=Pseudonocardia ailaonensis TaxID=367279 RepID=A0ABN2MMK0_9PSEU